MPRPSVRSPFTGNRLRILALALAPVLFGGQCHCDSLDSPLDFTVELTSLNAKRMPFGIEPDANVKDVKLKDRAGFKPSKGAKSGIEKRLRMKSKADGGAACYLSETEVAGNVSARVRVAFDSTVGLVDGKSLAFLERRPLGLPAGPLVRLQAAYDAANDGMAVTFLADGAPVGPTVTLPGAHDIHLVLQDLGTMLTGVVAEATGESLADLGVTENLGSLDTDAEDTDTVVAVGVEALGKKGTFWFDQLVLTFDDSVTHGEVETGVCQLVAQSWYQVRAGKLYLEAGGKDPVTLLGYVAPPISDLNTAWDALDAGGQQGQLLPTTDADLIGSSIEAALVKLVAADNQLLAIFDQGGTDGSKVSKQVSVAVDKLELAVAQLGGFHSKSHKQLAQSVSIDVQ